MRNRMFWSTLAILVFTMIVAIVLHPNFNVYAEGKSESKKSDIVKLPKNILKIQKENTVKNVREDTEFLEPSKATKALLEDSKIKIKNPDVIKMLNESTIQPSPIAIGYRATIYLGRWPLYYESDETSITSDYEQINENKLNNEKGDSIQQLNYKQQKEQKVHGLLTNKVDNTTMIKKMVLETAKQKTKLPLSFAASVGKGTTLDHFYDVQEEKTGTLEAYVPAVNESGKVMYGEVYIKLKGSQKSLAIKNVTKQEVGAWIPIQDHIAFTFQAK